MRYYFFSVHCANIQHIHVQMQTKLANVIILKKGFIFCIIVVSLFSTPRIITKCAGAFVATFLSVLYVLLGIAFVSFYRRFLQKYQICHSTVFIVSILSFAPQAKLLSRLESTIFLIKCFVICTDFAANLFCCILRQCTHVQELTFQGYNFHKPQCIV